MHFKTSGSIVLRKWHGRLEAFIHNSSVPVLGPSSVTSLDVAGAGFMALMPVVLMALAIIMIVMFLFSGLIILTKGSAIAPFIYTLF